MLRNHDFFRELLDTLYDGVYFTDRDRVIIYWNKGAERMSGYPAAEVLGRSCMNNILCHVDDTGKLLCLDRCPLAATMEDGEERQAEVYLHHRDGHRVPITVKAVPIRDVEQGIVGAVEIFSDNSTRYAMQQQIKEFREMAYVDPLTNLANRRYLETTLEAQLAEMARFGWKFGLLFFDIDHFKDVNDIHGHEVGDAVLTMVAKSMAGCSRPQDTVGRWGGEEFLAIIPRIDHETLLAAAERYRAIIEHSGLLMGEGRLRVTVSMGATRADTGDTVETLLKRADELMYQSKLAGRNRVTCDR